MRERTSRLEADREHAEAKFEAKRKQAKELEAKLMSQSADGERERALFKVKFQNFESQNETLQCNMSAELQRLKEQNSQLQE